MSQPEGERGSPILRSPAYRALQVGLIVYGIAFLYVAWRHVSYPYPLDLGEGLLLDQCRRLSEGDRLYKPFGGYPYKADHYPPLYPLMAAPLNRAWGTSFAYGRLISVLATLGTTILLYRTIHRITANRPAAMMSSLLYLASPYVLLWSSVHRVDSLGLFFTMSGIVVSLQGFESRRIFLAIPLFLLAGLSKQTFIAAPLAVFVTLLVQDRRRGIFWGLIMAVTGAAAFGFLLYFSDGEAVFHLITSANNRFSGMSLVTTWIDLVRTHPGLIGLAAIGLLVLIYDRRLPLEAAYLITASFVALGSAKVGSSINYFLEFILAASLVVGRFLSEMEARPFVWGRAYLCTWTLLALQLICGWHPRLPSLASKEERARISAHLRGVGDRILSIDPGLPVIEGKTLWYHAWAMNELHYKGNWDPAPLIRDLQDGRFTMIVLRSSLDHTSDADLTPSMRDAVGKRYHEIDRIGNTVILVPGTE